MIITKQEYESLIDSRVVDLERSLQEFKNCLPIVNNSEILSAINSLIMYTERIKEAYEKYIEAEEQERVNELETQYQEIFKED